ncbi:MAG TPA: ABC transporter permease [Thermomicrobiales bacterium]|nr:ABC transporter permease [Thermomicrobiales bacterium]
MILYLVVRRLFFLVFVMIALSGVTFTLMHVVPSDPARNIAGPRASPAAVQLIREEYGLDDPVLQRYATYMRGIVRLDLGQSLSSRRPVTDDLKRYLPATMELAFTAFAFALLVGVPLGVVSAVKKNTAIDAFGRVISVIGLSMPSFWLAIVLQFFLFARLGWFPDGQRLPIAVDAPRTITSFYTIDSLLTGQFGTFVTVFQHLALPAFVLGFISLAPVTRMIRSSMLEVLNQDYIRTARAKGLRQRVVVTRHGLKNALLPAVTVMGLQLGLLLSGTVLVEIVFSWPGIGRYAFQAIQNQDPNALISVTLVIGLGYVLANLIVDVIYMFLDPRIRVG